MRKFVITVAAIVAMMVAAVPAFANPNGSIVPMIRPTGYDHGARVSPW